MTRFRLAVASFAAFLALAASAAEPFEHVDPFIGTGGHGHTHPAATLPFGLMQVGPDTRLDGWDGCSGYHYTDHAVYGFSHTHLSGTGILDYGDVLFTPLTLSWYGERDRSNAQRPIAFGKETEHAEPGYYTVEIGDPAIGVELTATERAAMHRYRFPSGDSASVVVDLEHRDTVVDSSFRLVSPREIEGHRRSTGWAKDQVVYFVARFSRPVEEALVSFDGPAGRDVLIVEAGEIAGNPAKTAVDSRSIHALLDFGELAEPLVVEVGISAVDVDGARRNLDTEIAGRGFDEVRAAARDAWAEALGKIDIEGGSDDRRTIFYTALYHSMLAPNVWSDVDGRYLGMDREIHHAGERRHYSVFSLWDTFRATHPLFTILETERTREFVETFLAMYEQGGRLPVWELAANETDTMIGYHAIPVIVEAWFKGIRGFDADLALEAMVDSARRDHFGLEAYRRQGFIGSEDAAESVSRTLEYAYDDACIARLAQDLGRDELAREFDRRSESWRHVFDPESRFMRARRNQRWVEPFDPRRVDVNYTEANSWQYSFFVPHDVGSLIEAHGGDDRFVDRLDEMFEASSETLGRDQADITGLIGQYAHGNEPSHHMAFLYHHAGRPDLSAERVREIRDTMYQAAPDGLSGNEDCGQMSSWQIFAAIGLYPVDPCSARYVVFPPEFERATLRLENGRTFTIDTQGTGAYVAQAKLNGKELDRSWLEHSEIAVGGELVLELSQQPGATWGRAPKNRPGDRARKPSALPAPYAQSDGDVFRKRLKVRLESADPAAEISYATRPGKATVDAPAWRKYRKPLVLDDSTTVSFVARRDGLESPVVTSYFHRIPNAWTIELPHEPAPQYSAGGHQALIDGVRGDRDWRTGGWHGYRNTDFEATVDLGKTQTIRAAGASFLQEVRSWIWMPLEVEVSVSADGRQFTSLGRAGTDVAQDLYGDVFRDVRIDTVPVDARWVRVRAKGIGTIPDWHPGAGERGWIFVDEILIDAEAP